MRWIGPRHERTGRRLLGVLALVLVLLLAVNPTALLLAPEHSGVAAAATPGQQVAGDPCAGQCYLSGGVSAASIFPLGSDRRVPERSNPEVVDLTDDRAGALFDVLSSETARTVLQRLVEEPLTASELADDADTSLQNVHYHLENLREADAIAEIGVEYSARGREMSVYTATHQPRVLIYDSAADTGPESD